MVVNNNSNESTDPNTEFLVTIKSTNDQLKEINVVSDAGILYITASDNLRIEDDVVIELNNDEIFEIKLESDQKAVFEGAFEEEELHVKTEANSELTLSGIFVERLISKQEGESILNISSETQEIEGPVTFPEDGGALLNDTTLLVNESYYVYGDSIKLELIEEDSLWVVYGDTVEIQAELAYCEFKTEGNTFINAENARIRDIYIKLEGSSEAKVWATDRLSGKGEGSSTLYYKENPIIEFNTSGGAKILPL